MTGAIFVDQLTKMLAAYAVPQHWIRALQCCPEEITRVVTVHAEA